MTNMILDIGLKNQSFKKGSFMWDKIQKDFIELTTLGQKSPSKKDKWTISLEIDGETIEGECDYNTARIIQILSKRVK